ncbi:putative ATP-dependent DNA ligase YkoU [Legionella santicrucis]|uniref:DNA ligase (ATP) n=1 Tax=Legionella santicrucis TaxID=45074 RepID=A0A0W0Y9M4_9GAMM|nr:DNA ligase D [Legionella santicrucis]KTD53267.1 putative ATP-dependent DNA ligase YkoU [Legionella santicrucis]
MKLPNSLPIIPFPEFIQPQLATLADKAPEGPEWLHEIKFDGYRIIAFIHDKKIHLKTRNNNDWTSYLLSIEQAIKKLSLQRVILDGELVLLDKHGYSDFQLLQNTIKVNANAPYVYYIFDILYYDQFDLRSLPLLKRKQILKELLAGENKTLRYSDHIIGNGGFLFQQSCDLSLEGIISKRIDSPYLSKRSTTWLKVKCQQRQEFIIIGYIPSKGRRHYFRSLFLGVYNEHGKLEFVGKVGTGFTEESLQEIFTLLQKEPQTKKPFNKKTPDSNDVIWVKPKWVVEVEFTEWTAESHLRHPSFKGLRLDKKPEEIFKEEKNIVHKSDAVKKVKLDTQKHSFKITHPDKVLYLEEEITKRDLLNYYEIVAEHIMPFIKDRVLSLVRCTENRNDCFFQRHYTESTPKALKAITVEAKVGKKEQFIYLNTKDGLYSLIQMDVLEIHPWGSLIADIEKPDFIVIDLDPDPSVAWETTVKSALEVKKYLQEFKLTSFVKTTGGKGLHVVVPIQPEYGWDEVKNFAHVFVAFLEKINPECYVSKMTKSKRKGKIFIDYLRNQRGATAISPYSTRARAHAPVAVPISWDELTNDKRDSEFTLKTLPNRLKLLREDPWTDYWKIKQSLRLDELK